MLNLQTPRGILTIRPTGEADADSFRELRLEALREHPEAFASDYEESREQPREFWVERLRSSDRQMTFVVEESQSGHLLGLAGVYRSLSAKIRHGADIWGVYVRAEWRGLKLSDSLIAACLHWAREHQIRVVRLSVVTTNEPAIRCYQRCGFQQDGRTPDYIHANGRYYDEYYMSRRIFADSD